MKKFSKFNDAIDWSRRTMHNYCYELQTEKWQGKVIEDDPRYKMIEILNHSFSCAIDPGLDELRKQIRPNLPWADDHFKERVSGIPYNPPPSHEWWPFAQKSNAEFGGLEKFSHTYPERMWPKLAHCEITKEGSIIGPNGEPSTKNRPIIPMHGIRYEYGDLQDVVNLIKREPFTRQAFLPMWFPEDTGCLHGGRIPCSLGWHFIRRFNHLHVSYFIRSCDIFRHLRDDVYMCARLVIWMLESLRALDPEEWNDVQPGMLTFHCTSLHAFSHEKSLLLKDI